MSEKNRLYTNRTKFSGILVKIIQSKVTNITRPSSTEHNWRKYTKKETFFLPIGKISQTTRISYIKNMKINRNFQTYRHFSELSFWVISAKRMKNNFSYYFCKIFLFSYDDL